jgi:hypothetical protein
MTSNPRRLFAASLLVAACTFAAAAAFAAGEKDAKDAKKYDPSSDPAMQEMMKYAMPGPMHAAFKPMEGKFKAVVKTWVAPGAEPVVSEGVSENSILLGGRYLENKYTGTMMGQPFEGMGLTGFDNKAKKVWSMWIDNMSTKGMASEGTMSEDGKTMTCEGIADGPDGKPMKYKTVTKVVDANTHTYSMTTSEGGKEVPWMEITYTRQ